jgi:hypothetical protein
MGLIEILLGVVFTVSIGLGFGLGAMGDAGSVEFWIARGAFIIVIGVRGNLFPGLAFIRERTLNILTTRK